MFTVKNYKDLLAENYAMDYANINRGPLGTRGVCMIAAFTDMYKDTDPKKFEESIRKLPGATSKKILQEIMLGEFKTKINDPIEALLKGLDADYWQKTVNSIYGGKDYAFPLTLPYSGRKVELSPASDKYMDNAFAENRFEFIAGLVKSVDGAMITKEGVKQFMESLDFKDFEYLIYFYQSMEKKLGEVDWTQIIKN